MKTFREHFVLAEMPELMMKHAYTKEDDSLNGRQADSQHKAGRKLRGYQKISTHPDTGHEIWHFTHPESGKSIYRAVRPDGKVDMQVTGLKHKGEFHIDGLKGRQDSHIKAAQMYHHIVTHHDTPLRSDFIQSHGGKNVWQKLSDHPDIGMEHLKASGGPTTLHRGADFHKNYYDNTNMNDLQNAMHKTSKFRATRKVQENTSDPDDREWGKGSLVRLYKKETPGQ